MENKRMLATAIQFYLVSRPQSEDTLEAIHDWWLRWSSLQEPQTVTLAALEGMEAAGVVKRLRKGSYEVWRRQAADRRQRECRARKYG